MTERNGISEMCLHYNLIAIYNHNNEEIKTMKEVETLSKELEEKTKTLKEKANKLSGISKEKLIEAHTLILKNNI